MIKSGDVLHNPLSGETFVILKTSADTRGALFQMETHAPANSGTHVPPHLHPIHIAIQKALFAGMAFIAKLIGYPDDYPYQ